MEAEQRFPLKVSDRFGKNPVFEGSFGETDGGDKKNE